MGREIRRAKKLEKLRERIKQWRLTRSKQGPMPGKLWDEAASLARSLGVSAVSRELGLGYQSLQERTGESTLRGAPGQQGAMRFIEMSGAQLANALPVSPSGPVIELVVGDGARLTVRLPEGSELDVAGLLAEFRRRG